jgi:hypothetical protein
MNASAKIQHEEWMSEDDIAIYDQMISMGRLQIGKEIAKNEEYLLHIASMITLKQMKGMMVSLDDPTIAELKKIHQEHLDAGLIFETPISEWYESARVLQKPYLDPAVEKEINEANAMTSNLVIDKSTSNIADEPVDDIKEGYVKIVARPEPVMVEATPEPVMVEATPEPEPVEATPEPS